MSNVKLTTESKNWEVSAARIYNTRNDLTLDASGAYNIVVKTNGSNRLRITDASAIFLNNIDLSGNNLVNVNNIAFNSNNIRIGNQAGSTNQATNAIAIGYQAGNGSQGTNGIALGYQAGFTQQGTNAIAIGYQAGLSQQGTGAIAIGYQAGSITQSTNAISIGTQAGTSYQGTGAVAIGYQAGNTAQGQYAIAIGGFAGPTGQNANSIVINASGTYLNSAATSSCYITPIRNVLNSNFLYYNTTNKEITYNSVAIGGTTSGYFTGPWSTSAPGPTDGVAFSVPIAGTYLITANGSSFLVGTGNMNVDIYLNTAYTGYYLRVFTNETNSHKTLVPTNFKYNLNAGTNYIFYRQTLGTSDTNDYGSFSWVYSPYP